MQSIRPSQLTDEELLRQVYLMGNEMLPKDWALNGSATYRYQGNLNIRRTGLDVARLMSELRDIAFSAGSACASGSGRPSHVLWALGLTDAETRSSLRIGFGRYTSEQDLRFALSTIFDAADKQGQAWS